MKVRRARVIGVVATAFVVAVVVAACGGSSSPTASNAANTSTSSSSTAPVATAGGVGGTAATASRTRLATCLKKYGVTLPAGRFGGGPGRFGASGARGFRRFGATGATGARRFFGGATGGAGVVPGGGFPGGGGGFAANPKFAAALAKCGGFGGGFRRFGATGAAGAGGLNPATNAAYRAEIISYAACMKTNGVDLPTPNFSGVGFVFGTKVNEHTTAFIAANTKCQALLRTPASTGA